MFYKDMFQLKIQDKFFHATIFRFFPKRLHPNHLTMARFILTPVVAWLAVNQWYGWVLPSFLLVALTGTLDRSLARVRNQVTQWGKIYDPVADKLLVGSLVIILVLQHLSVFLGIAILFIEFLFIALGWWWLHNGQEVQANFWGKAKMLLQIIGVTLLILGIAHNFQGFYDVSATSFYLALVFAIVSLFTSGI